MILCHNNGYYEYSSDDITNNTTSRNGTISTAVICPHKKQSVNYITKNAYKWFWKQTKNIPTLNEFFHMIHTKYNGNRNLLAELLCSEEDIVNLSVTTTHYTNNITTHCYKEDIHNINILLHAKYTLYDWLKETGITMLGDDDDGNNKNNSKNNNTCKTLPLLVYVRGKI